ncbi:GspH/FimT family pseudopilin [Rhodoferax bucti]|uniref:GspH/FimT family pseudopilin n=1 Tax=Rhodoferax bucti TaxID=2576305 RepID=UPI0011093C3B|nr:GspH/FimT family pseudopilin [Rhodoferax bucti]
MNKQSGVTLIEAMVTIAILAIVTSIATPSFLGLIASSELSSTTNDLITAIAKTRNQAISTGTRVSICKSADGTQCTNNGNWEQGWISFIDTTRAGNTAAIDAGEKLISASQNTSSRNILIQGDANLIQYISFGSDGTAKTMGGAPLVGTIRVCSTSTSLGDSNRARDINLTFTGRASVVKVSSNSTCAAPT